MLEGYQEKHILYTDPYQQGCSTHFNLHEEQVFGSLQYISTNQFHLLSLKKLNGSPLRFIKHTWPRSSVHCWTKLKWGVSFVVLYNILYKKRKRQQWHLHYKALLKQMVLSFSSHCYNFLKETQNKLVFWGSGNGRFQESLVQLLVQSRQNDRRYMFLCLMHILANVCCLK